jgi:hypothetical protein
MNLKEKVYTYKTKYPGYFTLEEEAHIISWFRIDMRNYERTIEDYIENYPPKIWGVDILRPVEIVYKALRTSTELDGTVN